MPPRQLTFPEPPPEAMAQARGYLRQRSQSFDTEILELLKNQIVYEQGQANRQALTASFVKRLDSFCACGIALPPSPLKAVESIQYVDADDQAQTLDPSAYRVYSDYEPGYVCPVDAWPAGTDIEIYYTCGYGTWADVPEDLRMLFLVSTDLAFRRSSDADELAHIAHLRVAQKVGDVFTTYR